MGTDITTLDDIKYLVDAFYTEVRKDTLIGPIFAGIIRDKWPEHLEKMYRFWQTILLSEHTYDGSPFPPHSQMPLEWKHFERWLSLFNQTVDSRFAGEKADEAKWRAGKMAKLFHIKIEYYKNNQRKPLI
jgi:hemoglobin